MKINKRYGIVVFLLCMVFPFFATIERAQAYSYSNGADTVMDKITKYNASEAIKIFKSPTSVRSVADFLHYGTSGFADKSVSCSVPVPNTVMAGTADKSPTLSCWDFWYGNKSWSALIKGEKSNSDPSINDAVNYVKQLGYTQDASVAPSTKCFKVTWTNPNETSASGSAGSFESGSVCVGVDDQGYMWGSSLEYGEKSKKPSSTTQYELQIDTSGGAFGSSYVYKVVLNSGPGYNPQFSVTVQDGDTMKKWTTFKSEFDSSLADHNKNAGGVTGNLALSVESTSAGSVSSQVTLDTTFSRNSSQKVVTYSGNIFLSEAEVYNIYQKYLTNGSKVKLSCDASYDYDGDSYEWIAVQMKRNGKIDDTCHVRELSKELYTGGQYYSGSYDPTTNTLSSGSYLFTKRNMSLADIVKAVNKMDLDKLEDDIDDFTGATEDGGDGEGKVDPTCANSGGAGSLGWIVCPILDWMQSAAEGAYNSYVKPNLEVQSDLFGENNGSNPTQDAWTIFQGFANVCFIILFLVVIFSQLTGVGIDNYGIKKLLPKLIVVAVLVNLSYLICLLCVDLSNILGNAFQSLFNGLGVDVSEVTFTDYDGNAHAIGATTITAVALVGVLLLTGYAIWQNPALLLTLLVGVLGVLISIFFLFVLLAARKAAIVVLTVVSPVAFVCYLLPNTKKLFDRWLQLWKAMLLLYPICGLLIGGGDFVSRLLLVTLNTGEGEDFFGTFTAMIVGIIPIFFIPTVLKSAFAAMGTIGSKIAGFGTNARGAATKWMRNREEYKGLQERGAERRARIRAGVDREGRERDLNGFQRAIRGGRKGLSRSRMQYAKNLEGRNREEDITTGTGFAASLASAEARADTQRVADYESLLMNGKVAGVNANDAKSVGQYHAASLAEYQKAQSEADRAAAMAKIKAAQNILSKTDKGRAQVQNNLEQAVRSGQTGGLSQAASHLLGEYGDKYKSVNRGEHAMIADLATASVGADGNITSEAAGAIQGKLDRLDSNGNVVMGGSGAYSMAGTSKYTEESLAGADDAALDKLVQSVENGSLTGAGLADLKGTATRALEKAQSGNLNIKPEVRSKLQRIRDYEPPLAGGPSNPPASSPKPVTAPGSAEEGRTFEVPRENRPAGNTGNKNDVQVNPGEDEGYDQSGWD